MIDLTLSNSSLGALLTSLAASLPEHTRANAVTALMLSATAKVAMDRPHRLDQQGICGYIGATTLPRPTNVLNRRIFLVQLLQCLLQTLMVAKRKKGSQKQLIASGFRRHFVRIERSVYADTQRHTRPKELRRTLSFRGPFLQLQRFAHTFQMPFVLRIHLGRTEFCVKR